MAEVSRLIVLGPDNDSRVAVISKLHELCGSDFSGNKAVTVLNLQTKYYRAPVEVHAHKVLDNAPEPALQHELHDYEAVICVVDAGQRESFLHLHQFAKRIVDTLPYDVCLLVADTSSATKENVKKMEDWSQSNGFEFVDLDAEKEPSDDNVIDEKQGMERVLEALHCNMWRSMEMNPKETKEEKVAVEKAETETEKTEEVSDDSRLQTLLQALEIAGDTSIANDKDDDDVDMAQFSALISEVRNVRDEGQSLTDEQRRERAAEVAMKLWNFLAEMAENEVNLVDLSLEQLNSLKGQLEKELQQLTVSFGGLREAQSRFSESKDALKSMAASDLNKDVLVPLTASMFVPGKLASKEEVLVDVGTGYFVEQSVEKAEQFMDRKVEFLQSNTDQLKTVIDGKRNMLEAVLMIMQQKMQEAQQAQRK
ncbi:Prefoldin subunit [Phytophthora megakarya]|uniref:Prefoldin subunit n=1 Tax=Phytophthora megakarya TaxID=4795 RepID=A0A225VCE9_9STRA|nr:Prefoldin subunit [Phytophthora megakarya]